MKTLILTIIALLYLNFNLIGEISNNYLGIKGANFLKIGLSPRAEAMGSSYISYGKKDINSIYYNPAGLTGIKKIEFQFSTIDWIDNISINYIAFAKPSKKLDGILSSSFTFLYISPITYYDDWGEDIGTLSFYNMALTGGYARTFGNYHVGANIKFLFQKIAENNNFGIGFDLGGIYKFSPFSINLLGKYLLIFKDFNIGAALKNIGSKAGADHLPTSFEFGYSFRLIKGLHFSTTIIKPVYTASSFIDSDYKMNFGLEYVFKNFFFIRNGYKANYDIPNNFTLGFGVKTKFKNGILQVDYAYAAYTYLEKTHRFGLTVKLKDIAFWK